jgi:hypothetical protein
MRMKVAPLVELFALTAPFLVAIAHPLTLVAELSDIYALSDAYRTILINITVAATAICLSIRLTRNLPAAVLIGVLASLLWQFWRPLLAITLLKQFDLVGPAFLLSGAICLCVAVGWWARTLQRTTVSAIGAGLGLVISAGMIPPVKHLIVSSINLHQLKTEIAQDPIVLRSQQLPDIYHILLDGYARQDVLTQLFDVDNGEFIEQLEKRGFKFARHATASYTQTVLSTYSMFSMNYLAEVVQEAADLDGRQFRKLLTNNLHNTTVIKTLSENGYKVQSTRTIYSPVALAPADDPVRSLCAFNLFEAATLSRTPVAAYCSALSVDWAGSLYRKYFREAMERGPVQSGPPVFEFRHVLSPHPPFVLDSRGNEISPVPPFSWTIADAHHLTHMQPDLLQLYRSGYAAQVQGLNQHLLKLVDRLIAGPRKKIIIFHGDHGSGLHLSHENGQESCLWERFSPFLAVFATDGKFQAALPDNINLVNLYRVLVTTYFELPMTPLPNRHFYSPFKHPAQFTEISTEEVTRSCGATEVVKGF